MEIRERKNDLIFDENITFSDSKSLSILEVFGNMW